MRAIFDAQRAAFDSHRFRAAGERRSDLRRLVDALRRHRDNLTQAVDQDTGGRAQEETSLAEVLLSVNAARDAARHVAKWMRPRHRRLAWMLQPARAWIQPQPLGVVGIVAPWNYPILLAITPLAGALAAGNRVMLKLSEHAPATAESLRSLLASIFPADQVAVVTGDAATAREFTSLPFDHLLFTGATSVARDVMRRAADNLTPVTLELGGKSPAIVTADWPLRRAAEDIVYGKLLNAGQTCIGVDYVLAPRPLLEPLLAELAAAAERYFSGGTGYTAVRGRERLESMVDQARVAGVRVAPLLSSAGDRMMPVALLDPPDSLDVMQQEIFGPIVPVKPYDTIDEAIDYVNARPRPLALYLFSRDRRVIHQVLHRTISGAVCVNDTLSHIAADNLPFGGVGASGMGRYHGREGFDTFSQLKPVLARRWPGVGSLLRPPYTARHNRLLRWLIGG